MTITSGLWVTEVTPNGSNTVISCSSERKRWEAKNGRRCDEAAWRLPLYRLYLHHDDRVRHEMKMRRRRDDTRDVCKARIVAAVSAVTYAKPK